jgi:flavodoxin
MSEENNKKLVVYYSYTGHTKMIAESIKNKLNCDILEIEPEEAYSKNYDLVVNEEQNNSSSNKTPKIKDIKTNLSKYDTIILGSPVWWYTIVPVIRTFLKENDLSGKKIIPYATNAGWLGHTFQEIEKLCPNSKVEKGMNIVFTEDYTENELVTSPDEIDNWISKL